MPSKKPTQPRSKKVGKKPSTKPKSGGKSKQVIVMGKVGKEYVTGVAEVKNIKYKMKFPTKKVAEQHFESKVSLWSRP